MNERQKIFLQGAEEKFSELYGELENISRDRGDKERLFYDEILLRLHEMRLAFKRYIVEVVE